ncbi:right-handed parallel beta-helix repeat-containing protein [Parapedobacter soli]|uniref:right-handed parallel beta-helix repeat-containing protein n=1 Tax=Parapedobacter soli TaxID=416955 RepID=UPI0021C7A448|nr:right-handed parallel beta-helix repeat-containing protein [Parapedobacter soli]
MAPKGSGVSGLPIVIDQYGPGAKPLIDGNGLDGAGVVSLYNQSHWEINNLEVTNDAAEPGDRRGVEVKAGNYGIASHIHLKNLHVHHITGTVGNGLTAKKSAGIYIATTADDAVATRFHDLLIEGCHIHHVDNQGIVTNNEVKHSDYPGTPAWLDRCFTDVRIRNNRIHHISKNAIIARMMEGGVVEHNLCYETATKITGNTIFSRSSRGTVFQFNEGYLNRSPDYDGSLYDPDLNSPETIWQYSYSHDNAHGLVWFCTSAPDNNVIVRYNVSQNDKGAIFCINYDNKSVYIYNNVVYIPEHLSPVIIDERKNAEKSFYFYNNIIYNLSSTASYNWYNAKRHFSNNLFFGEHIDGEPSDPFKITEDPLFVDPGSGGIGLHTVKGYQLRKGSPALGTGRPIPDNGGRDYFGNPLVYSNKTDIGIHQRSAIPHDNSESAWGAKPDLQASEGAVQLTDSSNPVYVNGLPVEMAELKREMSRLRARVIGEFARAHQLTHIDDNFWNTRYDGQRPIDVIRNRALDTLVSIKVQQQLMLEYVLLPDTRYHVMMCDRESVNEHRRKAAESEEVIYGPVHYTESDYFDYLFTNRVLRLQTVLGKTTDKQYQEFIQQAKENAYITVIPHELNRIYP